MSDTASTVEADLAAWSGGRIEVSAADDEIARALLLDSLAVMGTGIKARASRSLLGYANVMVSGDCPIVGTAELGSPAAAALRNGTAGAAELWDDTSLVMNTHSSVPIFATLLSDAVAVKPTYGQFIEAYVAGMEVQLAIVRLCGRSLYQRGYHSTGLLGAIGAAVATGHLRGYSPEQMLRVIGISASMGSGLRVQFGSDVMPLHSGLAAERGLAAADLAAAGIVPDERTLTGRYGFVQCHTDAPGAASWSGPAGLAATETVLKRYPVGAPNMAPVDAVLQVRSQLGPDLRTGDIDKIVCRADRWVEYTIGLGVPPAPYAGRVNLPFCVAAALLHGDRLSEAFVGDEPVSSEIRRLIELFTLEVDDMTDPSGQPWSSIEVTTREGHYSARSTPAAYVLPSLSGTSGDAIRAKMMDVASLRETSASIVDFVCYAPSHAPLSTLLELVRAPPRV